VSDGNPVLCEIVLQPPAGLLRIVTAGVLLVALGVAMYRRAAIDSSITRSVLGGLRVATLAALVVILLGPSMEHWISEKNYRRKLIVAMDTSCSFATPDVNGRPRFEAARRVWLDPARINALRDRFDVRFYRYDEQLSATGPGQLWEMGEPTGRQTYIAAAVNRLLETEFDGGEPAGILLIGDGHETGTGDPVAVGEVARQRGVPIWTSCFGGQRETRDIAVQTSRGQEVLFTRQTGRITAQLVQTGFGLEEPQVTLLREGKPVQEKRVLFRNRTVSDVGFDVREEVPGLIEYEIRVQPLSGEADASNNSRAVFVQVTNEKIRVLLAEGRPYWDTKFLAQALRSDPQVELTQVVRYGPSRLHAIRARSRTGSRDEPVADEIVPVPRTKTDLLRYDVLIFGKALTEFLPAGQIGLLKDFLNERGGGVVFARGRAYDPDTADGLEAARTLGPLEPVVWGEEYVRELQLELTPAGRLHPSFQFPTTRSPDVIVRELPGMIGAVRIRQEKAAALVLARSQPDSAAGQPPMAAIAYQNYGKGKVVSILNEGLWRWAFLPRRHQQLDQAAPFDLFWRRMLRWLVSGGEFLPGQDVALSIARFPENLGEAVRIEVRLKYPPQGETQATLIVIGPDDKPQHVPLDRSAEEQGLLWASFEPQQQGVYRVRLHTPGMTPHEQETRFCAYDYSPERIQTAADPVAMRDLAETSGGRTIDPARPDELFDFLEESHPTAEAQRRTEFIWDRPWVFLVIVLALGLEWFLRRRMGVA